MPSKAEWKDADDGYSHEFEVPEFFCVEFDSGQDNFASSEHMQILALQTEVDRLQAKKMAMDFIVECQFDSRLIIVIYEGDFIVEEPKMDIIEQDPETAEGIRLVTAAMDFLKKFERNNRLPMVHFDDCGDYDMSVYGILQEYVLVPLEEQGIEPEEIEPDFEDIDEDDYIVCEEFNSMQPCTECEWVMAQIMRWAERQLDSWVLCAKRCRDNEENFYWGKDEERRTDFYYLDRYMELNYTLYQYPDPD